MSTQTLTDAILAPHLAANPAQPLLTFYDDASGERTELSTVTLANWAAKTANMIRNDFGLAPGAGIGVDLPTHWQTAAILLGAWWAGCETRGIEAGTADVVFCARADIDRYRDCDEVVVASLDPFAMGYRDLPLGVTDFASAVRIQGDRFTPTGQELAIDGLPVADVLERAGESASAAGISARDRVLCIRAWTDLNAVIDTFVAATASGASLVQVAGADPERIAARAATERTTVTLR